MCVVQAATTHTHTRILSIASVVRSTKSPGQTDLRAIAFASCVICVRMTHDGLNDEEFRGKPEWTKCSPASKAIFSVCC